MLKGKALCIFLPSLNSLRNVNMYHTKADLKRRQVRERVRNYRRRKKLELEAARKSDSSSEETLEASQEAEETIAESMDWTAPGTSRSRPVEEDILRTNLQPLPQEAGEAREDNVSMETLDPVTQSTGTETYQILTTISRKASQC